MQIDLLIILFLGFNGSIVLPLQLTLQKSFASVVGRLSSILLAGPVLDAEEISLMCWLRSPLLIGGMDDDVSLLSDATNHSDSRASASASAVAGADARDSARGGAQGVGGGEIIDDAHAGSNHIIVDGKGEDTDKGKEKEKEKEIEEGRKKGTLEDKSNNGSSKTNESDVEALVIEIEKEEVIVEGKEKEKEKEMEQEKLRKSSTEASSFLNDEEDNSETAIEIGRGVCSEEGNLD